MTTKRYSLDGDDYPYECVGDLFDAMSNDGAGMYVGREYYEIGCRPMLAEDIVDPFALLEAWDEKLAEDIGYFADNAFCDLPKEAKKELYDLLEGFVNKLRALEGYWKTVGKSRALKVTQGDLV